MEFLFYVRSKHIPIGLHILFHVIGNSNHKHTIARNSVVHLTTIKLCQANALITIHGLEQETAQQLDSISTLFVDVITRVTTNQSLQLTTHKEQTCRSSFFLEVKLGSSITTTRTRNKDFTFVLRVKVDEIVASHEASLHTFSTRQTSLFVTSEYTLDRTMLNVVAVEHCQFHSTTNTIVGTKCSTLSCQPLAIDICLNSVCIKVKLYIYQFVTDHIHVTLQNHRLAVFHALSSTLTNDDVTSLVNLGIESTTLTPVFQVFNHLLFTL